MAKLSKSQQLSSVQLTLGNKEYFKGIGPIKFEGRDSDNLLAYRFYDPEQIVGGKSMRDHLRFAVCHWHTFCGAGGDPFGAPTKLFPWLTASDPIQQAKEKMDAAFEFITKLGVPFY